MICWTATAADLIVNGQLLMVIDPNGQTVTKAAKSSFMLSRSEFQTATAAIADTQDLKKQLASSGTQRETIVSQLSECQDERDALQVKSRKRMIWIIAAGSSGLAIGVVFGVLVR